MPLPGWQIPFVTFSFISIFLYIIIIGVITVRRKILLYFNGSYFTLILSQSIAEWAMFLQFMILYRGRKFGYLDFFLKEPSNAWDYVPRFSTFLHYYLKIVIYIGQVYFALNRFTAIYKPMNYEKLWTKKRIWCLRLIQYSIPLFFTCPIAFNSKFQIYYEYNVEQHALRLMQDDFSAALVAYIDGGASFLATVFCSVVYTIVILKASRDMLQYGLQKKRIVELRLAFCGVSLFIVLLLNNIVQLMTCYGAYFNSRNINLIVNDLSYPVIDLLYSITPWALLFTSTEIQRQLTPCIPRKTAPSTFLIRSGVDNLTTTTTNFYNRNNISS